ncbi:VPA1269 family protein [Pseudomonas sp. K1(2024)]|uniref:VPA1269 family protein n=1 Tax=Pseudomonas boreofloridensis TaxID=3064348 RepID=A0ABV4Z951_9PSED|nr:VPA1269 family protein [Pseudomonas sp. K13]MDO7901677.1 VPA1269 family protein [Pseudomonas sp. K13]
MYNDSGESDDYFVRFVDGKPDWVKNMGPLAKHGRQEGFVRRETDSEGSPGWGMHFTSDKTSYDGDGYDVPWIPEPMIYWLTVLRDWQQEYNLITRLTPLGGLQQTYRSLQKEACAEGLQYLSVQGIRGSTPDLRSASVGSADPRRAS